MIPEIARPALKKLTTTPASLGSSLLNIAFADSPAEFVARKFVVTVERTRMMTPYTPSPEMIITCEMSSVPMHTTSMPMKYIQRLATVYANADNAVAFLGILHILCIIGNHRKP